MSSQRRSEVACFPCTSVTVTVSSRARTRISNLQKLSFVRVTRRVQLVVGWIKAIVGGGYTGYDLLPCGCDAHGDVVVHDGSLLLNSKLHSES